MGNWWIAPSALIGIALWALLLWWLLG